MRTSNPVLNANTFAQYDDAAYLPSNAMTVSGTANKTLMLLGLVMAGAFLNWSLFTQQSPAVMPLMIGGAIGGAIVALITVFKPVWSPFTAPVYALLEGLLLGGLSGVLNAQYPGIAFQAVCLTFGTLFSLMLAYQSGWVRATAKVRAGIIAATGAIALLYLAMLVMSFFNMKIPFITGNGPLSIGFSVIVVIIAAANLILDFDFIEQGAAQGAPKYMEWYGAFGLLVTLVWLYIEILRLLSKLRSRD
jgi:uncharacterized YccA/Bax inhibitor family protein